MSRRPHKKFSIIGSPPPPEKKSPLAGRGGRAGKLSAEGDFSGGDPIMEHQQRVSSTSLIDRRVAPLSSL